MADTKISALTAASAAALANEHAINEAGTSKKVTQQQILDAVDLLASAAALADANKLLVTQSAVAKSVALSVLKDYIENAFVFAAGSASANSWPKLTSGTLLTTPEEGALELDDDCFYGTTDAGNRGYIPVRHFIRCDSARTLPNDTNENPIFNSPTNGRLTLETGTYLFEGLLRITSMSATSGNARIDIRGAGTATLGSWLWFTNANDTSTPSTPGTDQAATNVVEDSAAAIASAGTGTGLNVYIRGSVEVTAAGTIIPSIALANAAAAVVAVGSFMMFERIGSTTVVSVGQWD